MAKGKNAAALFEVIHTDKRFGKSKDPAEKLSTPKWWFKGRPKAEPAPVDPTVGAAARRAAAAAAEPPPVFVPPDPGPPVAPEAADEPPPYDPTEHALRSLSALSTGSSMAASHARGSDEGRNDDDDARVAVDPDRGEIRLKLTYTSAIIGTFAIVVVLGLAYVLGRHLSRGPTPVLANSGEIRRGPVQPGVLNVGPNQGSAAPVAANTPAAVSQANMRPPAQVTTPDVAPPRTPDPAAPQPPDTLVLDDGHRRIGMQYVVVQSWPPEEKQLAEEAVKSLKNSGIAATLESGLPYAPRWVSVVGMKGFDRTQGSHEYGAYIQKIMQVSDKFAGTKKWKAFDPKPLTWKETHGR